MHYRVHGHTVVKLIYKRADADKEHMGLTWEGAPHGKIHKYDVTIDPNYLTEEELQSLGRNDLFFSSRRAGGKLFGRFVSGILLR